MSEPVELVLSEREEGIRLDKVLAERLPDLTRTAIQRLLEEGIGHSLLESMGPYNH